HRAEKYLAWTDGRTFICANRKTLKEFSKGLPGVQSWLLILVHEMTHDTDDSESHDHGEVFYKKFHDTLMQEGTLRLAELAQAGLVQYLQALNAEGLSRPRELMRQIQPKLR
ncbi:hypothetical protein LC612_42285, partial [Nostoc sp. CHAB 5834]|nr:hypothetical protein [Nostoc sp. CHAB 5834]